MACLLRVAFGVIDDARARRQRRWLRAAAAVAPVLAVVAIVVVASGGSEPGASTATASAAKCVLPRPPSSTSQAAPEPSLLASFAVLRQPLRPSDSLASQRYLSFNQEVFVRYIRRTSVVAGIAYYVIPALFTTCEPGQAYWGITFKELAASGTGPGGGTIAKAAIVEQHGLFFTSGNGGSSTVAGLVPDPVASVTLSYPATAGHPAIELEAKVVRSAVVFSNIPRNAATFWTSMVWRGANGKIIKTF